MQRLWRDGGGMVRVAARNIGHTWPSGVEPIAVGSLGSDTDWRTALEGVAYVIHCAARVHVMRESEADPGLAFRRANVEGSVRLATMAAEAGCRRLVFLSSIKVNGEASAEGHPFSENDVPAPMDAYGCSKRDAEIALFEVASNTGLEVVVIRSPLVYGPGVKANFHSMMRWLHSGVPLPFGAIDNRRSLVALDNLVDLLVLCTRHPAAANQVFLAGDGEDVSTADLLRRTAKALGCTSRLLPVPTAWLQSAARLLGKEELVARLCGNLQADISKARSVLGWTPPIGLDDGLKRAADNFLSRRHDD